MYTSEQVMVIFIIDSSTKFSNKLLKQQNKCFTSETKDFAFLKALYIARPRTLQM